MNTTDNDREMLHQLKCLAIGRVLRMGARPFQEGDEEEYLRCKRIAMMTLEEYVKAPNYLKH